MRVVFQRYTKRFLIILVAAIIISVINEVWYLFDSSQKQASIFLMTNREVKEQLGTISSHALHKTTYVDATENEPPYREYLYLVKGSKMKARVIIRVDPRADKGIEHYSIVEIRKMGV